MKVMLTQINEKRMSANHNERNEKVAYFFICIPISFGQYLEFFFSFKVYIMNPVASDFIVDKELEEQRFKITEKKLQMIHLQAKIDALGGQEIVLI